MSVMQCLCLLPPPLITEQYQQHPPQHAACYLLVEDKVSMVPGVRQSVCPCKHPQRIYTKTPPQNSPIYDIALQLSPSPPAHGAFNSDGLNGGLTGAPCEALDPSLSLSDPDLDPVFTATRSGSVIYTGPGGASSIDVIGGLSPPLLPLKAESVGEAARTRRLCCSEFILLWWMREWRREELMDTLAYDPPEASRLDEIEAECAAEPLEFVRMVPVAGKVERMGRE